MFDFTLFRAFLFLFTSSICLGCMQVPTTHELYVTDFGARADDQQLDTKAIQEAIDFSQQQGGGTVIFPTGTFQSGTIQLRQNVSIRLDSGSIWQASSSLSDYDTLAKVSFLVGEGLEHISITGKGIIDGQGNAFWDEQFNPLDRPTPWIRLSHCRNIHLEGIRFQNSPSHTLRFEHCDSIWISNVTIWNPLRGPNTDGIDVVDSRHVWIEGCSIRTGDDAICLKSSQEWVESVHVDNCRLISDDAAIKFGTSSKIGVRDCRFQSIHIDSTRYGIALFMLEGGRFQNNTFTDITIKNSSRHRFQYPIYIDVDRKRPSDEIGRIEDISFQDLVIQTDGKVLLSGHPEQPLRNIRLEHIDYSYYPSEIDFSEAKKPRGNKNYPKLADSYDFAYRPEPWVIAFAEKIKLEHIRHADGEPLSLDEVWQHKVTWSQ